MHPPGRQSDALDERLSDGMTPLSVAVVGKHVSLLTKDKPEFLLKAVQMMLDANQVAMAELKEDNARLRLQVVRLGGTPK